MWIHISNKEINKEDLKVVKQENRFHNKPLGLWFGWARVVDGRLESEWLDFMEEGIEGKYIYEIEYDKSKVLEVTSSNYTKYLAKYKGPDDQFTNIMGYEVNWEKFSHDYDGIVFTNYYKSFDQYYRKDIVYKFHDLIDIKSGCVWNPDSITKMERLIIKYKK